MGSQAFQDPAPPLVFHLTPSLSASSPDTSHITRLLLTSWLLLHWFFAQLKFHSQFNIQFSKRNQHANDSVSMKSKNTQNQSMVTEVRKWESPRAWLEMGTRDFPRQWEHSRSCFWLVATQMCAIVKTYQTGYLTSVLFFFFLYINNTFFKKIKKVGIIPSRKLSLFCPGCI